MRALPALCAAVLLSVSTPVLAQLEKIRDHKPFSIISSKLNKELKSSEIEAKLMCKSTLENMAMFLDLIENYDGLRSGGDHSMAILDFAGTQGGKPALITLMVTKPDQILRYVWVNGTSVLRCSY